jgi:hypothetical protein
VPYIARQYGGSDDLDNLAMACAECNLHKGRDLSGIDHNSIQIVPLFNPRQQQWDDHFYWDGVKIMGENANWPSDRSRS